MTAERRYFRIELRAAASDDAPPVLEGVVPYGSRGTTPTGQPEVLEPGSLRMDDVVLNRQHNRDLALARTDGGGLELSDRPDGLHVRAELPDTPLARETVELVRSKVLRGLSPEFMVREEHVDADGVRRIDRADLVGLAVVDSPAYPEAEVAARAAAGERPRLWL